ncbi:MAG: glucose 1-dehydrogenase [Anaerolineae bacterium]|nr:glucose 1-dehydrogenase [Anaerolineae bacterium]
MDTMFDLTGNVALVVGVGGIGGAQALGLARHGADVLVADCAPERAEEMAGEIRALGRKTLALDVDVTRESSVVNMVDKAVDVFGRIDILVNAAGINIRRPDSATFPIDEWQQIMDVNTRGVLLCCQAVGRAMIAQGGGKIINMSSTRGRYGTPRGCAAYCASKGAVDSLTRTLACEWARHNVLVNALAPTVVETEFTRAIVQDPRGAGHLRATIPLGRWAQPDDIVGPTIFLASGASDYVTGQILYVDGGLTTSV